MLAGLAFYVPGQRTYLRALANVPAKVRGAAKTAELAVSPGARRSYVAGNRATLRRTNAVPEAIVARIGSSTVHVVPWSIEVAYAYDLRWKPLPVIQDYSAYTADLDEKNTAALRRRDRPRFVLREVGQAVDRKVPRFEPPAQNLEQLCSYHVVAHDGRWQLLEAGGSRCRPPASAERRRVPVGTLVDVPAAPDAVTVARFRGGR